MYGMEVPWMQPCIAVEVLWMQPCVAMKVLGMYGCFQWKMYRRTMEAIYHKGGLYGEEKNI